mgnify:CR=1 FL=1
MPALQLHLDCKLSPAYLTLDLAENLQLLEPCGTDNPAALFGLFHLQLVSVSPWGQRASTCVWRRRKRVVVCELCSLG